MRRLAIHHGPFEPGLFTMLALIRNVPDVKLMYTANVLKGDAFLWKEGMPYDAMLANVSARSRVRAAKNFASRPGRLPHGTAGRLWQEVGRDLCIAALRRIGSASQGAHDCNARSGAVSLASLCSEIDRTLIEGLDLLEPAVRELAGLSAIRAAFDSSLEGAPTFFEAGHGSFVSVPGHAAELVDMWQSNGGPLWRGTWRESVEGYEEVALTILESHVKEALAGQSLEASRAHIEQSLRETARPVSIRAHASIG